MILKSKPNEINAVLILNVKESSFELEYTYDSKDIKYDKVVSVQDIKEKIVDLREQGFSEKVKK